MLFQSVLPEPEYTITQPVRWARAQQIRCIADLLGERHPSAQLPRIVRMSTKTHIPDVYSPLLSFGTLCILSHLGLNDRNNLFLPLRRIAWYRELTWSLLSEERTFWWKGEIWKILCAFNLSLYVILSYVYLSFLYTDHITHLYDSLILSLIEMKQTHKYS